MANKALIGAVIVLSLIIIGLIGYFVILPITPQPNPNTGLGNQSTNQPAAPDFNGNITAATFQSYPSGTQITPGLQGTITNIFNKGDQIGINGTSNVDKQVTLTIKVFDSNGNDLGSAFEWHGSPIKIQSGSFGFGVMGVPQTSGNYVLKIYLDNYESFDMPFQVL
ncbi:MAG: hypothetical protein M1165_02065 [Candidatus Pacearchaeota archaeon]|nr:hypothetical protein [Candidatus Pacearchaeota archaeon]